MEVIIAILVLACIAMFAFWRIEAGEREDVRFRAKCYRGERDAEAEQRRKYERENKELRIKCAEFADNQSKMCRTIEDLEIKNDVLHMNCEEADSQIVALESDVAKLRACTVEYAFSEWERKECADVPGRVLFERDGIVLIYECSKIVGWRAADTEKTVIRTTGLESEYEAPSAEVVEDATVSGEEDLF